MIRAAIRAAIAAVLSSVIKREPSGETLSLDFTTQTYRIEV
jgi:hypothetical protein